MAVDALIFDMDGTIIDTETADFNSWKEVYDRYNVDLTVDTWRLRVGWVNLAMFDPLLHLQSTIKRVLSETELREHHERYMANCGNLPILPGVLEMIQHAHAHGLKLGIASNSDKWWVEHWLQYYKLRPYFQCVYTRDDVANPKPHPEMYQAAAACLGVPVERCVAFEDSPVGMQAAISAGIRTVAIPNWVTMNMTRPEGLSLTLETLAELPFDKLMTGF
ncbi:MAG: HAD family phosphatase [Anaerolineae bacterium]|nr:HAD family phosphatase [Anaerolineae bacterium]